MNVLDLFSGIGGFSLGLERAGMKTIAFCEIEDFPRKVLKKHWPDVPIFEDVRTLHETDITETVDLICGGYPCQPFSTAGKRAGKHDDRHLWPEMFRLVREIGPSWIIAENVAGHVSMGLDQVLFDLEGEGYKTTTFIIPACAVNAPHRRDRVWIVANSISKRCATRKTSSCIKRSEDNKERNGQKWEKQPWNCRNVSTDTTQLHDRGYIGIKEERQKCEPRNGVKQKNDSNPHGAGCEKLNTPCLAARQGHSTGRINPQWDEPWLEAASRLCGISNGLSRGLHRNKRLKALGNAVVPQIPELIGRAIMQIESHKGA